MLVSVIIPTFNRRALLGRALASVIGQTFTDWELLIADDGSTDGSHDLAAAFPQARWLSAPRGGVAHARNRAARAAGGTWLAFLDSDDEWLPDKLERQLRAAGDRALVHGEELWIRDDVPVAVARKYRKRGGRIFEPCVDRCAISPSAALIRREVFWQLGGFDEDFPVCEDYDLWLKVSARFEVGLCEGAVVRKFAGHADQLSRQFPAMDYYRARALRPFLQSLEISAEERRHVANVLLKKCEILIKGYHKHNNFIHLAEVEAWAASARVQCHSAHSVADLLPRSVPS